MHFMARVHWCACEIAVCFVPCVRDDFVVFFIHNGPLGIMYGLQPALVASVSADGRYIGQVRQ